MSSEMKKRQVFIQLDDDDEDNSDTVVIDQMNSTSKSQFIQNYFPRHTPNFLQAYNHDDGSEEVKVKVEVIDQESVEIPFSTSSLIQSQINNHQNQNDDEINAKDESNNLQKSQHFNFINPYEDKTTGNDEFYGSGSFVDQRKVSDKELERSPHFNITQNDNNGGINASNSNLSQQDIPNDQQQNHKSSQDQTPDVSQLHYSQNPCQEEHTTLHDNTEYQTMDDQVVQDQELMDRIVQQAIERQDNIIYAIGEEAQFPVIDQSSINTFSELCQEMNNQMQFLFDYYEDLRKNNTQKFNSNHAQRQLIREKENLNTMLKQTSDENKDLQVKIKQYNQEIEELQKRINLMNHENADRLSLIKQSSSSTTKAPPSLGGNSQSRTPKQVIKQFINLDGSPGENHEEMQGFNKQKDISTKPEEEIEISKDDKIKQQNETIQQLEKQLQELKEQKDKESNASKQVSDQQQQNRTLLKQKSRENFKSKYYQLSLSNIEESDHESSFTTRQQALDFMWSRKIEEKDLLIQNLQERVKMLMQSTQVQYNVFNSENLFESLGVNNGAISNGNADLSQTPSKSGSFVFSGQNLVQSSNLQAQNTMNNLAGGSNINNPQGLKQKQSFKQTDTTNKDLISRSISQAQVLEEMLQNQKKTNQQQSAQKIDQQELDNALEKIDDLNRKYHEIVKDYKALLKEKNILSKLIDELGQTNSTLDSDFKILFKQVKQMCEKQQKDSSHHNHQYQNTLQTLTSFRSLTDYLPKHDIDDLDSLYEYISILFKEKNYAQAATMWSKINYDELVGVKQDLQTEYMRSVLILRDRQIEELNRQINGNGHKRESVLSNSRSPDKNKAELQKLNELVTAHQNIKLSRISQLESQLNQNLSKLAKQEELLTQYKSKIELLQGEKDFDRRKSEKLKKEVELIKNELRLWKDEKMVDMQEKYEKNIGQLKQEIRVLESKLQNRKLNEEKQKKTGSEVKNLKHKYFQYSPLERQDCNNNINDDTISITDQQSPDQHIGQVDPVRFSSGSKINSKINSYRKSNTIESFTPQQHNKFSQMKSKEDNKESSSYQSSSDKNDKNKPVISNIFTHDHKDIEELLRKLYSQFFTSEYKHNQDKIRNKNSVFKELFEITVKQVEKRTIQGRDLKQKLRNFQSENLKLKEEYEQSKDQLEKSQSYIIKLIKRIQNDQQSEQHLEDMQQAKLIQLLKLVSQLFDDLQNKISKLKDQHRQDESAKVSGKQKEIKLKKYHKDPDETFEEFMNKLTKEEVLDMLKELQLENEKLLKSSDKFNDELQNIVEEVKSLQQTNEELESENARLKRYCRQFKEKRGSRDNSSKFNFSSNQQNQTPPVDISTISRMNNISDQNLSVIAAEVNQGINFDRKNNSENVSQNVIKLSQFRTLDSRSSVETEKIQRIQDLQLKMSATIVKNNEDLNNQLNGIQINSNVNDTQKVIAKKPPRESNIAMYTASQPKSINPNKKVFESSNNQILITKQRPGQAISQNQESAIHKHSNSFYNVQKEIGKIQANQLNVNNYYSYNDGTSYKAQPQSNNFIPLSMTPTNKTSDYFQTGENPNVQQRNVNTNQNSYQNLHENFQFNNYSQVGSGATNHHKPLFTKNQNLNMGDGNINLRQQQPQQTITSDFQENLYGTTTKEDEDLLKYDYDVYYTMSGQNTNRLNKDINSFNNNQYNQQPISQIVQSIPTQTYRDNYIYGKTTLEMNSPSLYNQTLNNLISGVQKLSQAVQPIAKASKKISTNSLDNYETHNYSATIQQNPNSTMVLNSMRVQSATPQLSQDSRLSQPGFKKITALRQHIPPLKNLNKTVTTNVNNNTLSTNINNSTLGCTSLKIDNSLSKGFSQIQERRFSNNAPNKLSYL